MSTPAPSRRRIVVVSQTFVPDPAAVGQHMADIAFALAARGHDVRVYASARGYEDASVRYPTRELLHGVDVRRFAFGSFGKKRFVLRVLGTAFFHARAFFATLLTPRLGGIVFSTSPPLVGLPMAMVGLIRRVPVVYWAMDLNPDQLIAVGRLKPGDRLTRILEGVNRFILRRSALIVALDRFMAERLLARNISTEKVLVLPPWPHDDPGDWPVDDAPNPFRATHQLGGKFVVMYSGNHSPSNPLTTLLHAAVRLKHEPNLMFLFVGGGYGKRDVEAVVAEHSLTNIVSLPYQPLEQLKHSLTAADVHVVSLGEAMAGIIHPCKIYGAMAAARPVLFLGPTPSHVADLLLAHGIGEHVTHGDVDAAEAAIRKLMAMPIDQRTAMGRTARAVMTSDLKRSRLIDTFCTAVESALGLTRST